MGTNEGSRPARLWGLGGRGSRRADDRPPPRHTLGSCRATARHLSSLSKEPERSLRSASRPRSGSPIGGGSASRMCVGRPVAACRWRGGCPRIRSVPPRSGRGGLRPTPLDRLPREGFIAFDGGRLPWGPSRLRCRRCGLRPAFCGGDVMVGRLRVRLARPLAFAVLRLGRSVEDARCRALLLACALRAASGSLPVGGGTWGAACRRFGGEGRGLRGPRVTTPTVAAC